MQTTNKFLIVVDAQNDFVTGSLGSEAAQQVVNNIVRRTEMAKDLNETVIFTKNKREKAHDFSRGMEALMKR